MVRSCYYLLYINQQDRMNVNEIDQVTLGKREENITGNAFHLSKI